MSDRSDTPEDNIALMRAAFAAMQRRDLDTCMTMLTEDFLIDVAGAPIGRGRKAWRRNAEMLFASFSDVELHVEDMFAAGDKVAVRLRLTGRHTAEFLGHPPTGRRFDYKSNELYQVIDGKIASEWICSDTLTLMTQTGVLSGKRLVGLWLAGYRFWFGVATGVMTGAAIAVAAQFAFA